MVARLGQAWQRRRHSEDELKSKPRKLAVGSKIDKQGLWTILDSMVEAVFVVDESGRVALTNRALDELLDRDVRGHRPKNLIRSEPLRLAVRRARKSDQASEVEVEGEVGDRQLTFHAQVSPLPGSTGVVVVLHDVTSLKAADRVRRDFVANAAHELRTPLTAIRGFAETLASGALDAETSASFVEGILRQTDRLQRLTEDLAQLSRAETPEHGYEMVRTDVGRVCREVAASLEPLAEGKQMRIELALPERPVVIDLSVRALEAVLVNLIENAIIHSKTGEVVRVSLRERRGGCVLEVRDWGVGIPPELQRRVFERFFRVDPGRSREHGGSGLGLSIVKHLTSRMGGRVSVKSEPGKGARFRLMLPLRR